VCTHIPFRSKRELWNLKGQKNFSKFFIVLGESYFGKFLLAFAWRERERERERES
jgi:hypothetical protein